ncbi:MAG: hypothetical protein HC828_01955 [Blastochloris sp.]|nr:hypothetical protein [Blastochloris sp.]
METTNQTKSTAAPWVYDEAHRKVMGADGFPVAAVEEGAVLPGWGEALPAIHHWSDAPGRAFIERSEAEVAANGRLLAAAPHLLAACLMALEWINRVRHDVPIDGGDVCAAGLQAVIALAQPETSSIPIPNERYWPFLVALSEQAQGAIAAIARTGESDFDTINRILETLAASAPDFDHFYGEPRDGRGPSGV